MGTRYIVSLTLLVSIIAMVAGVLATLLPAIAALPLVLALLALATVGVALDLLPPGQPRGGTPAASRFAAVAVVVVLGVTLGFGALRTVDDMVRGKDPSFAAAMGLQAAATVEGEGTAVAAVESPPETPTPAPPTATATATPAVTEPAATPTPALPTSTPQPVGPTPTPDAIVDITREGGAGWLTGRWKITDIAKDGPAAGQTFALVVELRDVRGQVTGSGAGLEFTGQRRGNRVRVDFRRAGANVGVFEWTILPDGTMSGTFRDGNSTGTSVASRAF